MAGPTTDTLNEDIKDLRGDFHKSHIELRDEIQRVQSSLSAEIGRVHTGLSAEISRIDVSLAELRTQLLFSTRVAVWGISIIAGSLLTGVARRIWWASGINYKVNVLESRFDKLESSISKILEQTRSK